MKIRNLVKIFMRSIQEGKGDLNDVRSIVESFIIPEINKWGYIVDYSIIDDEYVLFEIKRKDYIPKGNKPTDIIIMKKAGISDILDILSLRSARQFTIKNIIDKLPKDF